MSRNPKEEDDEDLEESDEDSDTEDETPSHEILKERIRKFHRRH